MSGIKILDGETYHLMLEKYIPLEYKRELLQEGILDSVRWSIHA